MVALTLIVSLSVLTFGAAACSRDAKGQPRSRSTGTLRGEIRHAIQAFIDA